jgi:anti-sigma factor RsiW
VATCAACEGELARIRETAGTLREVVGAERRTETPECLDELTIADFVDGRLSAAARAPVVAHLVACARCSSTVRGTAGLLADATVAPQIPRANQRPWRRWAAQLAEALARAQRAALRDRATAHPFFWAGFALVRDR